MVCVKFCKLHATDSFFCYCCSSVHVRKINPKNFNCVDIFNLTMINYVIIGYALIWEQLNAVKGTTDKTNHSTKLENYWVFLNFNYNMNSITETILTTTFTHSRKHSETLQCTAAFHSSQHTLITRFHKVIYNTSVAVTL